jgi:hypothetical protein
MSDEFSFVLGVFSALVAIGAAGVVTSQSVIRHCDRGYYVDGVSPTGNYRCHVIPKRQLIEDTPPYTSKDLPGEDFEYHSHIYCTGGSMPIVVNFETVGCQPGGHL